MASRFCEFLMLSDSYSWECMICRRVLESRTFRESRTPLIFVCGVPSVHDVVVRPREQEPQHVTWSSVRENELIGQEGGRWDRFYMEEA